MTIDDSLRRMIHSGASELDLEQQARQESTSIREDGIAKVLAGVTSVDELLRVTSKE